MGFLVQGAIFETLPRFRHRFSPVGSTRDPPRAVALRLSISVESNLFNFSL